MTTEEIQACRDGYIYVHDMSARRDTMNCCLFDVTNVLTGGFEMGNIWYNEPKTLDVAFDVIGDIVLSAASQQYGGFTVPEVDKILEPYAEKTYKKSLEKYQRLGIDPETAEAEDSPQDGDAPEQLTEDDWDFIENSQTEQEEEQGEDFPDEDFGQDEEEKPPVVPVYDTDEGEEVVDESIGFKAGDKITHPRYGNGTVEKIIKYGNKTLCSIDFENVGRRLLDPSISDFEKI
jgi:hypothetical protein